MELKELTLEKEQVKQLIRELLGYEFAVRDMVRRNLILMNRMDRVTTGPGPFHLRGVAKAPPVPPLIQELLK